MKSNQNISTVLKNISVLLLLLAYSERMVGQESAAPEMQFIEALNDFPRKEIDLRKWDAPVVADLDQDGYPDLILNDHGLGINISWNNKGVFAMPYDLIMGDLHGVSVADFDNDGNMELILSRGGGSGSNARNSKMYRVTKNREFIPLEDFDTPLAMMRGRTVKFFDANNDGLLDLANFAFPSKEKKGKSENYIYKNTGDGQLVLESTLPAIRKDGQKTLFTDFNTDGVLDMILYGAGPIKAYQGKGDFTFTDVTQKLFPEKIPNTTAIAELDFDNDGDMDLYISQGEDFEIGETFYNKQTKTWGFFTMRGAFGFDIEVGDVLHMQNFQSQWPYNDAYYIGETGYPYEFKGETHSGKDIELVNSNALGFPDKIKEEGGIHIGYIGNNQWRIAGNTWSPTTGTVHGVLNYTPSEHPEGFKDILLENKNGMFQNVATQKGINLKEHTVGVSVTDFDHNGYQDILVIKRGRMVFENEALLYLNNDGRSFDLTKNHGIQTTDIGAIGMAVEVLDYDVDGDMDVIIGNERGKWHLFKNQSNVSKSKSITITIGKSPIKKASALGALVQLRSCTGTQQRRIGNTGAQNSLSFDTNLHFGLDNCAKKLKVEVLWSNGEKTKKTISASDQSTFIGSKN